MDFMVLSTELQSTISRSLFTIMDLLQKAIIKKVNNGWTKDKETGVW